MGTLSPLDSPLSSMSLHCTPVPSISQAFPHALSFRTPVRVLWGGHSSVFARDKGPFAPPATTSPARRRPRSAQCGNQRSKHVGAVDLPDSVGEDGIGSFVTEKTVDGVVG